MNAIEKIKAEIERLSVELDAPDASPYTASYKIGAKHALQSVRDFIENLEKEQPKIKGWVARCKWPCPDELYFYRGEEKPIRCGSHVDGVSEDYYWDFQHEVAPLDPTLFPDLKWEDEPKEVELIINEL